MQLSKLALRLLNFIRLHSFATIATNIGHLGIRISALALFSFLPLLFGLLPLLLGLPLGFLLGALLRRGLFRDLPSRVFLLLPLVIEPLDDRAGRSAEFVELGDVLTLCCVLAFVVEPVLCKK
jgi:hypothetical protein